MTDGPKIQPVVEPTEEQSARLAKTPLPNGKPLNLFATLAHHPRLLARINALGGIFLLSDAIPVRERELVVLRVSATVGSAYEWGHHLGMGRDAGLTDELEWVLRPLDDPASNWTSGDRALLVFTDELLSSAVVSDETWSAVAKGRSEACLLELLTLVGFYRLLAGLLRSVRVERDAGLPDPPDRPGAPWR
jgi:alkylhydroperoxidase family enzyme